MEKLATSFNVAWRTIRAASRLANRALIKQFLTYFFGAIALRGISLAMTPIMLRALDPAQYGILSLITNFINVGAAVSGLGLRQYLSLSYFHGDSDARKGLVNTVLSVYTVVAVPAIALLLFFHATINQLFFANSLSFFLIFSLCVLILLSFFNELFYQLMQYEQEAARVTILQCFNGMSVALIMGATIFFRVFSFALVIYAQLCSALITFVIAVSWYYHHAYFPSHTLINASIVSGVLKKSLPFVPSVLLGWLLASGDRFMLARYTNLFTVGIYATADLSSQFFYALILQPWAGAYLPFVMHKFNENRHDIWGVEKMNRMIMVGSLMALTVALAISYPIICYFSPLFLPSSYQEALRYVPILVMGQIFLLGSYFASCAIQFLQCTTFLAGALAIPAIANIIFNALLIPHFGIMGCAMATLISYAIYGSITILYNRYLQKRSRV